MAFEEGSASMMDSNTSDKGAHRLLFQTLKMRQKLTDSVCLYYKLLRHHCDVTTLHRFWRRWRDNDGFKHFR